MAWPAIATNITTPLLSLADVAIVGHVGDGRLVGAVAVGGTVFNILYWLFAFLRMGTSGMTSQAYGGGNKAVQKDVLFRGLIIALSGATMILVAAPFVGYDVITFVDGSGEVVDMAWRYFQIAIWGAPGVLVTFVVSGWLLGMQRSKPIMWIALVTNVLNIVLSLVFVYVLNMGIEGVGLGTALSQITGGIIGIIVVFGVLRKGGLKNSRNLSNEIWKIAEWKSMFRVNSDIFLRTLCLASVTLWFTHAGASIGAEVLSANSILLQFFLVFSYFMDGFAFGGEALAGKYFGAKDYATLRVTVRSLFRWGIVTSVFFTVLYFVAGDIFIRCLTDIDSIADIASDYRFWVITVPLLGFTAFTWDGIMIGLTRTRYLLASMAIAMIVFFAIYFIGTEITGPQLLHNHILWFAFVVYLGVRGLVSTMLYKQFERRLNNPKSFSEW